MIVSDVVDVVELRDAFEDHGTVIALHRDHRLDRDASLLLRRHELQRFDRQVGEFLSRELLVHQARCLGVRQLEVERDADAAAAFSRRRAQRRQRLGGDDRLVADDDARSRAHHERRGDVEAGAADRAEGDVDRLEDQPGARRRAPPATAASSTSAAPSAGCSTASACCRRSSSPARAADRSRSARASSR